MAKVQQKIEKSAEILNELTFAEFLEGYPPGQLISVADAFVKKTYVSGGFSWEIHTPQLQLHCSTETCNGLRFFRCLDENMQIQINAKDVQRYIAYGCSNCRASKKIFSINLLRTGSESSAQAYKFGEIPAYGPATPARLIRLFEGERETFLKGRQCENHGLGIGAFVYYRRVVENQKSRILDEIIRVSEKIGAGADVIETLKKAKAEIQFTKALESVKDALPQALLINGHNPLTLLHRALSVGLHTQTDEDCLKLAHDIRVVLIELAERLGQALKDEAELSSAISRLMNNGQN